MENKSGLSFVIEQKQVAQDPNEPKEMSKEEIGFLQFVSTLILGLIFIGIGLFIGYVLWGNKDITHPITNSPVTSLLTPAQSNSSNSQWSIYTDTNYSIKYPTSWLLKRGFSSAGDLIIYDPNSITSVTKNGAQSRIPTTYVDIISVTASSQSATQVVSNYIDQMKQKNITVNSEQSPVYHDNMVLFDNPGGSGKNVVYTNNNTLAMFNTSATHLAGNSIEDTILQSFQFTQQVAQ